MVKPAKPVQQPHVTVTATATQFQGPIPPPELLEGYERVCPGAADRILSMAEKEQTHRHTLEVRHVQTVTKAVTRGQWFGFALAAIAEIGAVWLLYSGKSVAGFVTLIAGIVPVATAFFIRQNPEKKKSETPE